MSKHKIVIIGGGFSGIKAALDLSKDSRFHITLISDHTNFRYYPTLFRTATGGPRVIASLPLKDLFEHKNVSVVIERVNKIDKLTRTVSTTDNHTFEYDAAIFGLGVKTNYFGIKGLENFSYGIKTVSEAERLKAHIHKQLLELQHPDLNYVVIGGGPTGVELAGILPSYIKEVCRQHGIKHPNIHVDLVEASPRLLPRMPKELSKVVARRMRRLKIRLYLGTAVQAQTADALMVNDKRILSHTVIWTAGIANHPFFADQDFQTARNGRVRVDQFLQSDPGVYVLGDNADTPYSGMAQTAIYDGKFVAKNLIRLADYKNPKPYFSTEPAYVFPAGPRWSAVLWKGIRIDGWLGYLLRRAADFIGYHDFEPFYRATELWMAEEDSEESCPLCARL